MDNEKIVDINEEDMDEQFIEVKLDILLTNEDIDDIMCAALEGGINYWCGKAKVVGKYLGEYASEQISRGGTLKLYDGESGEEFELTKEKFIKGLTKHLEDGRSGLISQGMIDTGALDACDADAIIQYALFDEVVYG